MKTAKPYPYLYKDVDRQGHVRWRLRAPHKPTVTIKDEYGSPEFAANYRAAMEGSPVLEPAAKHGTIDALARSYLRSADFARLAKTTQRARRHLVEQFAAEFGNLPVAALEHKNVRQIMGRYATTPGKARNVLSMLRLLMALAIAEGIRKDDPCAGIKRPKLSAEGWHTWTEEEIERFESHYPIGTQARLAFALALHTSQRSADLIKMGKQHVRNGRLEIRQQKTQNEVSIPIHPDLATILDATPSGHLTFLVTEFGKPYPSANSFGQRMKVWAREAGLMGAPLHGLRKACCRRLAEAGCTVHEIMSISGHTSLSEVEKYCRSAERKLLADRAIARTITYPRSDSSYPRSKKA